MWVEDSRLASPSLTQSFSWFTFSLFHTVVWGVVRILGFHCASELRVCAPGGHGVEGRTLGVMNCAVEMHKMTKMNTLKLQLWNSFHVHICKIKSHFRFSFKIAVPTGRTGRQRGEAARGRWHGEVAQGGHGLASLKSEGHSGQPPGITHLSAEGPRAQVGLSLWLMICDGAQKESSLHPP